MKFLNLSNHPSVKWSDEQWSAALTLAGTMEDIVDIPFPDVPPEADEKTVTDIANKLIWTKIIDSGFSAAMVQGEFTMTFTLIFRMEAAGIHCYAATTRREVAEESDGKEVSTFRFVRFRRYTV